MSFSPFITIIPSLPQFVAAHDMLTVPPTVLLIETGSCTNSEKLQTVIRKLNTEREVVSTYHRTELKKKIVRTR